MGGLPGAGAIGKDQQATVYLELDRAAVATAPDHGPSPLAEDLERFSMFLRCSGAAVVTRPCTGGCVAVFSQVRNSILLRFCSLSLTLFGVEFVNN